MCDASQLAANEHKCLNKSNTSVFQLKQELVNFLSSNAVLIAVKLDSSLNNFQCQYAISIKAKSNSSMLINMPMSQQEAMIHFYDGSFQFIVKYIYSSDSDGANTAISCKSTTFGANSVKLIETWTSQQSTLLYFNGGSSWLIVGYIYYSNSEGARSPPTTFTNTHALDCQRLIVVFIATNESNHEGAWAQATSFQTSKLIVIYSKKSLHFREDCGMFCEGEWEEQSQQPKHDLVDHYGVIGRADLINRISLVGSISLSGFIGQVSFIGLSIVGFVGLSLVSLGGLISHFSLVGRCIIGLIDLSASSNHWPIGLIGIIGLGLIASSASMASLACRLFSFVSLVGSSTHRLFHDRLTAAVIKATNISWQLKQAAALGVVTLQSSTTETAASTYAVTALSFHVHSLVREKMWWWLALAMKKMCWWIASLANPTTVMC